MSDEVVSQDLQLDGIDLYTSQLNDVADMRSQLLAIDKNDPGSARKALQNITILRVYHQISRIIRYTELMDKIEDKIYNSIEMNLDQMDDADPVTFLRLMNVQEKLQKSMIESHKLLEPYLDFENLNVVDVTPQQDPSQTFTAMILDQESREKIRTSAQQVLSALGSMDNTKDAEKKKSSKQK